VSVHESVFLLKKDKYEEFCELARLKPKRFMTLKEQMERESEMRREGQPRPAATIRLVTQEEMKTPEFMKTQKHYKKIWDFLHKNGKQPFKFNWSGALMCEVLGYLLEVEKINLMENTVAEENGNWQWHVLDKSFKKKFLKKLNPENFTDTELIAKNESARKQLFEEAKKQMEERLTPEMIRELEKQFGKEQAKEMLEMSYRSVDFPEQGEAMLDGIKYLHQYLECVDDDTVVLIHLG
jgi:hypothetical protein